MEDLLKARIHAEGMECRTRERGFAADCTDYHRFIKNDLLIHSDCFVQNSAPRFQHPASLGTSDILSSALRFQHRGSTEKRVFSPPFGKPQDRRRRKVRKVKYIFN
jgi:hypothetical protein